MLAPIIFGLYIIVSFVLIGFIIFVMTQTLKFGFMSSKTKRVGFSIIALISALIIIGFVILTFIDWSTWI